MTPVRVRFAPAPTGFMHLGNVRAALINFLYARAHNGTFVLRIEDTDAQRNFDVGAAHILADLAWLNLTPDEGPLPSSDQGPCPSTPGDGVPKGQGPLELGVYAPYFQSQRAHIYRQHLDMLIERQAVYRCFCTNEELEQKRQRQIAFKQAPRYDRTCYKLSPDAVAERLRNSVPFVWRLAIPARTVTMHDLARGAVTFDLTNFSDPALSRQDGSITFLFANFVDDVTMHITHVFRGEDHVSNTALQLVMYELFNAPIPMFWHLPIMATVEGKKLSKRDFGFSLQDLREAGYLPEAIVNYLAIIGGGTFENEIMALEELPRAINFDAIHGASQVRYDVEKLNWVNHQWIMRLPAEELAARVAARVDKPAVTITPAIALMQAEARTLHELAELIRFVFERPEIGKAAYDALGAQALVSAMGTLRDQLGVIQPSAINELVRTTITTSGLAPKVWYPVLRLALTGRPHGASVAALIELMGTKEAAIRLAAFIAHYQA